MHSILIPLLLVGYLSTSRDAFAESSLHLSLPPLINGQAGTNFPGWAELSSIQINDAMNLDMTGGRITTSQPRFTIQVTKHLDAYSVPLMMKLSRGEVFTNAIIEFTQTTGLALLQYQIQLNKVLIKSLYQSGAGGGSSRDMTEFVSLYSSSIAVSRRKIDPQTPPALEEFMWWDSGVGKGGSTLPDFDSDADGMPDDYETSNALNRLSNDRDQDLDGDGMSNYAEFIAGTIPGDPRSVLRITGAIAEGTKQIRVYWSAVSGHTYEVLTSSRVNSTYTVAATLLAGVTGETSALVPRSSSARTFLQIRVKQ